MLIKYEIDLESNKFITKDEIRVMLKRLCKVKRIKFKFYKEDNVENYIYPKDL